MTDNKIRLIWDFRGTAAKGTALHQSLHLGQFAAKERLLIDGTGAEAVSSLHWIAWMVVEESDVELLRKVLRPNRALPAERV